MSTNDSKLRDRCIFCKIANLQDSETRILYQNEEFVAFRDIRPAADHHYLVVTKQHIKDPTLLKGDDLELLERLVATGETVLKNAGGKSEGARKTFSRKVKYQNH